MIIIPARIASTRFPKKILYPINGVPMVILTAKQAKKVDDVVIATDDTQVIDIAKQYGFEAVLTSEHHQSGTDRVNEAAAILGLDENEIIVNVQGDEPFIEPEVIKKVFDLTKDVKNESQILLCSAYKEGEPVEDPNSVKVVLNASNHALYFSRSLIPYPREKMDSINIHLGIYGYTKSKLQHFCALSHAPLEQIEKLEQLRALYHGYKIAMTKVVSKSIGIDTPKDLEKINAVFDQ